MAPGYKFQHLGEVEATGSWIKISHELQFPGHPSTPPTLPPSIFQCLLNWYTHTLNEVLMDLFAPPPKTGPYCVPWLTWNSEVSACLCLSVLETNGVLMAQSLSCLPWKGFLVLNNSSCILLFLYQSFWSYIYFQDSFLPPDSRIQLSDLYIF